MILKQRKLHRVAWFALAPILLVILALGILTAPDPAPAGEPPHTTAEAQLP